MCIFWDIMDHLGKFDHDLTTEACNDGLDRMWVNQK